MLMSLLRPAFGFIDKVSPRVCGRLGIHSCAKYSSFIRPTQSPKGGTANQPWTRASCRKERSLEMQGRNVPVHLFSRILLLEFGDRTAGSARDAATQIAPSYPRHQLSRIGRNSLKTLARLPLYPRHLLSRFCIAKHDLSGQVGVVTRNAVGPAVSLNFICRGTVSRNSDWAATKTRESLTKPRTNPYNQSSSNQLEAACTL